MGLIGLITNEGLSEAQNANLIQGWFIYPTKIYYCDTAGLFNTSRTIDTVNTPFYTGNISSFQKLSSIALQFSNTLPIGQNNGVDTVISELAYFAETQPTDFTINVLLNEITLDIDLYNNLTDGNRITIRIKRNLTGSAPTPLILGQTYFIKKLGFNKIRLFNTKSDSLANINPLVLTDIGTGNLTIQKEFLLGIAQATPPREYKPLDGSITFRPIFVLANNGDPDLFNFYYTQATEVNDHNNDINAHPLIQQQLNQAGIFLQLSQVEYNGQTFDENPTLGSGVTDGKPVYLDIDGTYKLAQASGDIKELNFVGFYQNNRIKSSGYVNIGTHGFSIGSKIYLSTTTAGNLTTTSNNTEIGIVLNSNTILLTKKYFPTISGSSTIAVQDEGIPVATTAILNFIGANVNASGNSGIVNITVSDSFISLGDTPNSYVGQAGKYAIVNMAENGLEFSSYAPGTGIYLNTRKFIIDVFSVDVNNGSPIFTINTTTNPNYFRDYFETGDILWTSAGGFTPSTDYYLRKLSNTTFSLHPTLIDAQNNTNAINVVGSATNANLTQFSQTANYLIKAQKNIGKPSTSNKLLLPNTSLLSITEPVIYIYNQTFLNLEMDSVDFTNGIRFAYNNAKINVNAFSGNVSGSQAGSWALTYDSNLQIWHIVCIG